MHDKSMRIEYICQGGIMSAQKELGKRLRKRREELGLTQADMATKLGVAQETVSRWEAGLTAIPVAMLTKAAKGIEGADSMAHGA